MFVNGVPLDNPARGWSYLAGSKPRVVFSRALQSLEIAGRDGVIGGLAATASPPILPIIVDAPAADFPTLLSLFAGGGFVEKDGKRATFELASHDYTEDPDNRFVQVTFNIRLPGVYWRDVADTTVTVNVDAASVTLDVFAASNPSAPIQDALLRLQGAATGVQVTDSSGAWVRLPDAAVGEWVRFDSATGKAFKTTSDTWTGGVDVSGQVDFGGPRGVFEITPYLNLSTLARVGRLTITSSTRTGAVLNVRGRSAHML